MLAITGPQCRSGRELWTDAVRTTLEAAQATLLATLQYASDQRVSEDSDRNDSQILKEALARPIPASGTHTLVSHSTLDVTVPSPLICLNDFR